ncbi:MAG: hypothetical protein ACR2PG_06675, partial [Hyphomicrobiaceae bacterium]
GAVGKFTMLKRLSVAPLSGRSNRPFSDAAYKRNRRHDRSILISRYGAQSREPLIDEDLVIIGSVPKYQNPPKAG